MLLCPLFDIAVELEYLIGFEPLGIDLPGDLVVMKVIL